MPAAGYGITLVARVFEHVETAARHYARLPGAGNDSLYGRA